MEQDLQKLFKKAVYQPECRLSGDVCRLIEKESSKINRFKISGYLGSIILSLSGSVFFIKGLFVQLGSTGFYDYLSLAFSDGGTVMSYLKEYIFSLVSSLPIVNITISLFLLFILFISIRQIARQSKGGLLITQ